MTHIDVARMQHERTTSTCMPLIARHDFAETTGNADATSDCTLFLTEESSRFRHCARLSGNFAASTSRRCFDSCPKHLEERLRATSASSQLNDNGYSDVRARITPRRSRGLSRGIAAATSWNPAIGTTAVVVSQNVLLAS